MTPEKIPSLIPSTLGLVPRILILFCAILLIDVGADLYEGLELRASQEADLAAQALDVTRAAALNIERTLDAARQVLITLSKSQGVSEHDPDRCNALLRGVVNDLPMYDYISSDDLQGVIRCSSHRDPPSASVAGDRWQADSAITSRDFVAGYYGRGKISGNEVIRLSYPIVGSDGTVTGVISADISLKWLNGPVAHWRLPNNAVVDVADRHGILIARQPASERVGREMPAGLRPVLDASKEGVLTARDLDGITRVYGYAPVRLGPVGGLLVAVGLDRDAAIAIIDRSIVRSLVFPFVLLISAALFAWIYVRRFVGRPINQLVTAAARWQAGDWTARVTASGGIAELDRLAIAFDAMSEAVAAREMALQRAAGSLRSSQEHLARAQRVAAIGSFELDLATGHIEWSDETYRIFGVGKEIGPLNLAVLDEMIVSEDRKIIKRTVAHIQEGLPLPPEEYRIHRPDGTIRVLHSELDAIRDGSGEVIKCIGVVRDVTELRETEQERDAFEKQLQQAQKMDALGTLAGGIAHDLNNALVPVVALSTLLLTRAEPDSREHDHIELIHDAGQRARDLVRQILTFARKSDPQRRRLDAATVAEGTLRLLRATLPATITIDERIEPAPPICADEVQVNQVLINLVTNAAQAIGDRKGTISIEIASVDHSPLGNDKPAVRISVIDTGCGMDEDTRQRVFEPFFTTKPVNEGTGLGLSVVHGIVVSHGGAIRVDSQPGHGTRFDVYLPIAEDLEQRKTG